MICGLAVWCSFEIFLNWIFILIVDKIMTYTLEMFWHERIGCLPELFLLTCCLAELMVSLFRTTAAPYAIEARPVMRRVCGYLTVTIILMLGSRSYWNFALEGPVFWVGSLQLNPALIYTKVGIAALALFFLGFAQSYVKVYRLNNYEFGVLVGLAVVAMFWVVSAYNLMVLYLSLELQAGLFFILMAWRRRNRWSLDATIKYLLVNLLASVFFLLAIRRAFAVVGSVTYGDLVNYSLILVDNFLPIGGPLFALKETSLYRSLLQLFAGGDATLLTGWWLVIGSLLVAFSLKLGVAPFHIWVPAVYGQGLVPVVGLLATASKISYVAALRVLLGYVFAPVMYCWQWFFLTVALISVIWGNLALLKEQELLRFLGLSSVAGGGYLYLILGLAPSIWLYPLAVGYMVASCLLYCHWFLVMNTTFRVRGRRATTMTDDRMTERADLQPLRVNTIRYVSDLAALRHSSGHAYWAVGLALTVCSMAGIPPLLGFWPKFMRYTVFSYWSTLTTGYVVYLALVMLFTLVGARAYLRLLSTILFEEPVALRSYYGVRGLATLTFWVLVVINVGILWLVKDWQVLAYLTPYYPTKAGFYWATLRPDVKELVQALA